MSAVLPRPRETASGSGVLAVAQMKIVPLIAAGDERVREDVLLILRSITHAIRTDLTQRLDEIQSQLTGLRRRADLLEDDVNHLKERGAPTSNG